MMKRTRLFKWKLYIWHTKGQNTHWSASKNERTCIFLAHRYNNQRRSK